MKNSYSKILLVAMLFASSFAQAEPCLPDGGLEIEAINVGNVQLHLSHDGANAVYLKLKGWNNPVGTNGTIGLNNTFNLNDAPGPSILASLRTAFALRAKVQLWDHAGGTCDDFDEVQLIRD